MPLFAELQRRRVFRALVGYGIAAFAVLQIIEPIMHGLHWPDPVLSYVVAALAAGFPIVVSLAWIFDVNAGRIERTPPAAGLGGLRLAALLVGIGAVAAAPGIAWYFFLRGAARPAVPRAAAQSAPSIAVLPFVNLSSDKEQEYFSDGIAEEILNALAQLEGLRVIGRTSSFSFKGKSEDLRAIGEKLDAGNLLEGSVRRSGNHVRITAQLIEAAGGTHLWSQTFDRELTDVFAVQDEIARSVAAALRLRLLPAPRSEERTANPEAHNLYLLGRRFIARGTVEGYGRAVATLEQAVALDPGYALAWATLGTACYWAYDQDPLHYNPSKFRARALEAADKAIALAPNVAAVWASRGGLRASVNQDWTGAEADLERAFSLSPGDAEILNSNGFVLAAMGRLPQAIAALRGATALDPLSAGHWVLLSGLYLGAGQLDAAAAAAEKALAIAPEQPQGARNLGFAYLLQHRPAEARAAFQRIQSKGGTLDSSQELYSLMGEALVEHELGHRVEAQRLLDLLAGKPYALQASYQIAQVHAFRGEVDRSFEWLERARQERDAGLNYLKYDPLLQKVRGDPRYNALLRRMNLPSG